MSEEVVDRSETIGEQNSELEALTKSVAWGMVVAFIEDQVTRRMNNIMLTPLKESADLAEQNFARGECAGLLLTKKFIEDTLQVGREAVELYRAAQERGEM